MLSWSALIEMNIITILKHNNYVTLLSSKQSDKERFYAAFCHVFQLPIRQHVSNWQVLLRKMYKLLYWVTFLQLILAYILLLTSNTTIHNDKGPQNALNHVLNGTRASRKPVHSGKFLQYPDLVSQGSNSRPGRFYPWKELRYLMDWRKIPCTYGIRTPEFPAHSLVAIKPRYFSLKHTYICSNTVVIYADIWIWLST
jgi:hypothetical protein